MYGDGTAPCTMVNKKKVRKQQTVVVKRLSVEELRKIIEDAREQGTR